MSILNEAKFVVFDPKKNSKVINRKRKTICEGIADQIALAKNPSYRPTSYKWTTGIDGEVKKTRVYKNLKPWWYESENKTLIFSVKYRGKPLNLVDGFNGIEVADADELVSTLESLKMEFEQGELDHLFAVSAK